MVCVLDQPASIMTGTHMEKKSRVAGWGWETMEAVVITGGSSGIGEALIVSILNYNPSVLIFNLSRTKPKDERVVHISCDLSDRESITGVFPVLEKNLQNIKGKLLLINNSGYGRYGAFPSPTWEDLRDMVQVNLVAPMELTARMLPLLLANGGGVMNVSSLAGFQPTPFFGVYGASKSFLLHWSLCLRQEYRKHGLRVLAVCPGPTATGFFRAAGFSEQVNAPSGSGQASIVAKQACEAWMKDKPLVVTGFRNKLVALLAGSMPRAWSARLAEKVMRSHRLDHLQ
jgi:short-subunit dehydrogenase